MPPTEDKSNVQITPVGKVTFDNFKQTGTFLQKQKHFYGNEHPVEETWTRVGATIAVKNQWLLHAIACLHWPQETLTSLVWLDKPTCIHIQSYPISLQTISALTQPDNNVWQSPGTRNEGARLHSKRLKWQKTLQWCFYTLKKRKRERASKQVSPLQQKNRNLGFVGYIKPLSHSSSRRVTAYKSIVTLKTSCTASF